MALGTVTIVSGPGSAGSDRFVVVDIQPTAGANYTTGGDVIDPKLVGFSRITRGDAEPTAQAATVGPSAVAVLPQADGTAKLKSMVAAGTGENAANANLSTCVVRATLYGS